MSEESSSSVSARKLRANRRNARKSTGPRTEEGKTTSSRNSLVHGLYCAKDFILPGESKAQFLFMRQNHIRSLMPMNSIELSLVERVARNDWKIKRVHQMQQESYLLQMRQTQTRVEVLTTKTTNPQDLFTPEVEDGLTEFEKDCIDAVLIRHAKAKAATKKLLVETARREVIPQQEVHAMQFAQPGGFERFEQLEKMEQRFENAMDKALRELDRLRRGRRGKNTSEDELDEQLACPYLEEYEEIQGMLDEENEAKQALDDAIDEVEANEANEPTEEKSEDNSNAEQELAEEETDDSVATEAQERVNEVLNDPEKS